MTTDYSCQLYQYNEDDFFISILIFIKLLNSMDTDNLGNKIKFSNNSIDINADQCMLNIIQISKRLYI